MRREEFERPRPPATDRPSDRWVCGHTYQGYSCAHGPDASGGCPAMGTCRPVSNGNAWSCARPACFGGKCGEGPTGDGHCGQSPQPCTPRLSWRYRRRRLATAGVMVCLAAWTFMLAGSWRSKMLRPGGLTEPHAQILGSRLESRRCAACHPAADASLFDWFTSAGSVHRGVTQSQLCMDCHHTTLASERAMMAHNLTKDELHRVAAGRSRWHSSWRDSLPGPAVDLEHVHCAACHREHHGADANLTLMTSGQCQTCHQDRFQSFATDHPDWQDWPYRRDSVIAFDHVTHYGKHFAATTDAQGIGFQQDCRTCHEPTADGEVARLVDFETGCAACHADALRLEASEGITLLAIPSLPASPEPGTESWPEAATGFYDGRIDPLTRLLISGQGRLDESLSRLSPDVDLAKTDANDPTQRDAARDVATAVRNLMDEVAVRGNAAIIDRLRRHEIPEPTAQEIARQLSPQLVYDARERWFGQTPRRGTEGHRLGPRGVNPEASWRSSPVQKDPFADRASPKAGLMTTEPTALAAGLDATVNTPLRPEASAYGSQQSRFSSAHPRAPLLDEEPLRDPDPLLEGDLLTDENSEDSLTDEDPLLADPLTPAEEQNPADDERLSRRYRREDVDFDSLLTFGGWFQDDRRLAICYRGVEHADPVLRSVIDLAVALPPEHPVRDELLSLRSTASCIRCHHVGSETLSIRWKRDRAAAGFRGFTKFSHQPHLHLAVLENCTHCHEVRRLKHASLAVRLASSGKIADDSHQFEPLTRQTCVACHTANAAGDSCTKCHHYHVDPIVIPADPG